MAQDDGGSAFPEAFWPTPQSDAPDYRPGMSLRDWFAGQALAGLIASPAFISPEGMFTGKGDEVMGRAAYMLADAMLAARQKGGAS